ncbi:hypothetical protein M569_13950 [Genlisea aurea]|uniref:RING-type E3 ubiquitin transferase n=1 Tax=Genlisea aurea TaxID=192259 RepID=S8C954_9LAMI|nr:hypothetical protein M569_13950 [Genlisea aurea]
MLNSLMGCFISCLKCFPGADASENPPNLYGDKDVDDEVNPNSVAVYDESFRGETAIRILEGVDGSSPDIEEEYNSMTSSFGSVFESEDSDFEDECPICFEGYHPENPKIAMKCWHHYHLGCIYDWLERNATCPFCQQLLEFEDDE